MYCSGLYCISGDRLMSLRVSKRLNKLANDILALTGNEKMVSAREIVHLLDKYGVTLPDRTVRRKIFREAETRRRLGRN
jgi:hypothetical protein